MDKTVWPEQPVRFGLVNYLDVATIRDRLSSRALSSDTVDALYDFGKFMLEEVQQRAAYIDSKLGGYLTWAAALLGVLLIDQSLGKGTALRIAAIVPASAAMNAIVFCWLALRTQLLPSPSEVDWLGRNSTLDAETLKRHYVSMMHLTHQQQQKRNVRKASLLCRAENMLALSAGLTGIIILVRASLAFWVVVFP